jgi:ArsR family transcriptional regulator
MKFTEACSAMSDPVRAKLFYLLSHGERRVCDLVEAMGLPQSTVSRHLSRLREADLIVERREGTWRHYSLNSDYPVTESFLEHLRSEGAEDHFRTELKRNKIGICKI